MKKAAIIILKDEKNSSCIRLGDMRSGKPIFMHTVYCACEFGQFDTIYVFATRKEMLDLVDIKQVKTIIYAQEDAVLDKIDFANKYIATIFDYDYLVFLDPRYPCRVNNSLNKITTLFEMSYDKIDGIVTCKMEGSFTIQLEATYICKPEFKINPRIERYYLIGPETICVSTDWDLECVFAWHHRLATYMRDHTLMDRIILEKRKKNIEKKGILLIGDSIMDRWNIDSIENIRVFNMAVSNVTSKEYYEKAICNNLLSVIPQIVIISLGINDAKYSDCTTTKFYLQKIIDWIYKHEPSCKIFVLKQFRTFFRYDYPNDSIANINRDIELLSGIKIIECICMENEYGYIKKEYTSDGVHLSPRGYLEYYHILKNELIKNKLI